MNSHQAYKLLVVLLFIPFLSFSAEGLSSSYSVAKDKLGEAVENRNFQEAKHILHDLIPLMKEHLKDSRKEIMAKKSELNGEELSSLIQETNRKKEIYNRIHHLMNVSPAALRVKSKDVLSLVEEFEKLAK